MVVILKLKPSSVTRGLIAAQGFCVSRGKWPKFAACWGRAAAGAVLGFGLSATTTADVPANRIVLSKPDLRIARLDTFFKYYHCPAPFHTSEYLRAADGYGLDYRLLPAISIRETLCGITEKRQHNQWGYHPGSEGFRSIESGIDFLARRLTQHPYYKGKTLQNKLFTYNPRAAYADEVRRIMRQIE